MSSFFSVIAAPCGFFLSPLWDFLCPAWVILLPLVGISADFHGWLVMGIVWIFPLCGHSWRRRNVQQLDSVQVALEDSPSSSNPFVLG
uniref:Uncharacterized protein n=1 Tax=Fagus sylvatica TaxID=28930 RepID=A0A2N9HV48_FAGSY